MRKMFLTTIFFVCLFLILAACGDSKTTTSDHEDGKLKAPDQFLQIGSGPMGSGWYPITTILSELYMDHFDGLKASQLEGGSTANLKSLDVGDIQLGINYTSDFSDAINGTGSFDDKIVSIAAMASLYPVYQTIATLQDRQDIETIEDIVDKHIFLGPKGGGGSVAFWRMMEEYGITEKDVEKAGGKISYGNYSDGASMLADGNVDVFVGGGAPAVTSLQEIELTNPVKVIPIDQDKLDRISQKGYGISNDKIPAGTYKGMEEDVPTYTTVSMLTVRKDLDEEYVYNLTKVFWENLEEFEKQLPERAKHFTLNSVLDGIDPETLHPGAKKYYEEAGALK
ncbi:TAXI family TRAP transporter solute-binding subunit [Bacillus alveayuensis]|uniref:TAXI family TRAP transporter solute-binding subunit n=1 Tax=Aeribacillus alveayuensis TaxID=279215 RepID=UPI0005CD46A8|nr:TAXI family TRAP transporter solute-binding subunit [Bacillus alveayuensis]